MVNSRALLTSKYEKDLEEKRGRSIQVESSKKSRPGNGKGCEAIQ